MERPSYWVLNPAYYEARSKRSFSVGEQVDFNDPKSEMIPTYGSGPFKVVSVRIVQEESIASAGHHQFVQLSKNILLNGIPTEVVYDSYKKQWTMPGNLSYFGGIHPTIFSGAWVKPFHKKT